MRTFIGWLLILLFIVGFLSGFGWIVGKKKEACIANGGEPARGNFEICLTPDGRVIQWK